MYDYGWDDPLALHRGSGLTEAVRAFANGLLSPEDFQGIFLDSTVYCVRGEKPGFVPLPDAPQPIVPVFSSLDELRRYAGEDARHFAATGLEMLDLLPTGYAIVLDYAGDHKVVLDAPAIEEVLMYSVRRQAYR